MTDSMAPRSTSSKNILFDLDGTLTDPFLGITSCIYHALDKLQAPKPADLRWCIGPPLIQSFEKLLKDHPHGTPAQGLALYRERFATVGMFENELYGGIKEALEALKSNGRRLFVATSKPHVFSTKIVEHFGLSPFFLKVYGSELDGTRDDKGELIQHILESENLAPAETIMIGDRKFDVIGARKNSVKPIAITWGYGDRAELEAAGPAAIIDAPAELARYLLED